MEKMMKDMVKSFGVDYDGCLCHKCIEENNVKINGIFSLSSMIMILCPLCGNKRCPHASDHNFECTNSNKPDQKGSIYC